MDASHIFPQSELAVILLIAGMIGFVVSRVHTVGWAGLPLCSVVVTALLGVESAPQFLE